MTVRELNGWTPKTVTFGADGEVLTTTVAEPRFTEYEKQLLLMSRQERRGRHGILMSEAMDPANQFAFETTSPVMDWAQKTLNDATEAYRSANPKADLSAVHIQVRKRG